MRSRIRMVFAVAFVLLVVQFAVGRTVKEFYPGWVLPGFAGVASPGEFVVDKELDVRVHFRSGDTARLSQENFLPDMVHRRRRAVLWNLFPKDAEPIDASESRTEGRNETDADGPLGAFISRIEAYAGPPPSAAKSPELRRWLRDYLADQFDGEPVELVAEWHEKTYVRETRELESSETLSVTTLDFDSDTASVRRPAN